MTVYYMREGKLVEAATLQEARDDKRSIFPAPRISRIEPYASPIDGKEITSWGARDRDMKENNAVDPRDVPRKQDDARSEPDQSAFSWR
jgi:hypothetical protein